MSSGSRRCAAGFYDNTPFHRVIEGFMAQGGDPTGTGTGGARSAARPAGRVLARQPRALPARHLRHGALADPNSANSQFFIMFAPAPSLDGQYTIWGRVASGMEAVDRIKRGTRPVNGRCRAARPHPPHDRGAEPPHTAEDKRSRMTETMSRRAPREHAAARD
jgi:cyclophilin family peptidyl-prolyl cis-trans isomerase